MERKKHWPDLRGLRPFNLIPFVLYFEYLKCKKHWPDLRGLRLRQESGFFFSYPLSYVRNIDPIWGDCDSICCNNAFIIFTLCKKHWPDLRGLRHSLSHSSTFKFHKLVRNIDPIWGDCDTLGIVFLTFSTHVRNIDPIWGDCDLASSFIASLSASS